MMETDIGVIGPEVPDNEIAITKPEIAASHTLGLQDLYKAAFSQEPTSELTDFGKEPTEIHSQLMSHTTAYTATDDSTIDKADIVVATNLDEAYQLYTIKTVRQDDGREIGYSDGDCGKIDGTSVVLDRPFEVFHTIDTNSVLDLDKGIQIQVVKVNDGPSNMEFFHTGDSHILQRYLNDASFLKTEPPPPTEDALKFTDKPYKSYLDNSSVGVSPEALGVRFEDCDFNSSDSFASTESIIPKNIQCPKCPKKFMFKSDLMRHDKHKHSVKPKLACEFCNKEFASQQNLMFHEKSHRKRSANRCEVCQKVFKKLGFLVKHMMKKHSKVTSFACGQCDKTFSSRIHLSNHRRKVHSGSGEVDRHFRCHICAKTFEKKHGLSCHVKTHDHDQAFTCSVCGKSFAKMQYLKSHVKCHVGEEKRGYTCETCGKMFKSSSALEEHTRKHTGEKPFTCDFCLKSFAHKAYFKAHIKKHEELKRFPCAVCQKTFVTSEDLTKHERKHAKDKSYRCTTCNQDFGQQSKLTAHCKKQKCGGAQTEASPQSQATVSTEKAQEVFIPVQSFEVSDPTLQSVELQNVDLVVEQSDFCQPIVVTSIGGLLNSGGVPVILAQAPAIPYSMSSVT